MNNDLSSIVLKYAETGAPEPKPGDLVGLTKRITPALVKKAKKLPRSPSMELEDLVNIGLLAAFEGISKWRPDGGATLSTYAITAGYRAMLVEANESQGVIRIPYETNRGRMARGEAKHSMNEVSAQDQVSAYVDSTQTIQDLLVARESTEDSAAVLELHRKLAPQVFDSALQIGDGVSGTEVGADHGVCRQAIFQRLQAVRSAIETGGDLTKGNYKATKKYEYDKARYRGDSEYRAAKRDKARLRAAALREKRASQ